MNSQDVIGRLVEIVQPLVTNSGKVFPVGTRFRARSCGTQSRYVDLEIVPATEPEPTIVRRAPLTMLGLVPVAAASQRPPARTCVECGHPDDKCDCRLI